ncbi:type IX secretion system membrane protein PorP/SprF [Chitinophaga niabensis]|uniref:PorP/SprF family type IX secretion system membrane protein n=1 Tax=Chitinophaga niabensis TaxID=536979 RepID=UPI0031BB5680
MTKRSLYILLITIAFAATAKAQQLPHYTQYLMNPFVINPAVAGIENYWDIKASHRHQWAGLQDAPVTSYLTAHGPLGNSNDLVTPTGSDIGYNPRGRAYWTDYERPSSHPGMGLMVMNDVTGPIRRFAFSAAYAHHIGLAPKTSISVGIGAGIQNYSLDADKLNFANASDPAVGGIGLMERWKPDVSAGIWLYSADFFAGVSANNIIPQELTFDKGGIATATERGRLAPHIFITAGYRLWINDDISVLPSLMFKYISPVPLGIDINARVQYRDRLWIGANYRNGEGFAGMLGVYITPMLNVGYAYDYTTSSLNFVSKGSHEITLGLILRNRNGDYAPRNSW